MTEMTNQLLLLAQAESTQPGGATVRVDVAVVAHNVLEELVVAAQRRRIDLGAEITGTAYVPGSATLLTALVANLVDNAIRYTQEGGRVTAACREEDNEVVLQVIDNGPGIPAEARAQVFERFYRGTTDAEGTGLGLSIVREIVHSHGGTVALGPDAKHIGLVVTVRLPRWRD
jgi:two-component system sensor histidine kinase TctE